MSSDDHEIRIVPSVLDRLVDHNPENENDVPPTRDRSVRDFRRQVQRDLGHLLNSRNSFFDVAPAFPEVGQSVITYGLPDFSARTLARAEDREKIRRDVQEAIAVFEPRLTDVTVTPLFAENDRSLRLRIEGRLLVPPGSEVVAFDVDLSLQGSRCDVKERS